MLFNSMNFLIFFPLVTLFYFVLPLRVRNYWLLVASYFFYMCWNPKYVLLLLASTVITYLSGISMERIKQSDRTFEKKRRLKNWVVAFSFVLNIGALFYFKYINFALEILTQVAGKVGVTLSVPAFDVVLPVGISFYIFQALSYTMDVYRDEIYAERNFFRYALFVSFFPQLVAGPIERSKNLLVQLSKPGQFEYERVRSGLLTMLWGFFLKLVIADRVAQLVNTVYDNVWEYHGMELIVASVFFAFQIYGDFMGYSTIAVGAARVLGFDLMENFHMPYLAISIKDFWRRWHISLSSWLRDYLYIPLGGNRKGRLRKYFNLMLTFFVSGLWHGASFTYVAWGLIHGAYQIIEDTVGRVLGKGLTKCHINTEKGLMRVIRIFWTFIWADVAWVFFRANYVGDAIHVLKSSLQLDNAAILLNGKIFELGLDQRNMIMLLIALLVVLVSSIMRECGIVLVDWVSKRFFVFRYIMYWFAMSMLVLSMDIGGAEFIYFQF